MVKKFKTFGPQLVFAEQSAGSVVVTNEQKLSLYKKSQKSGISTDVLEEVYRRGYRIWNESFGQTPEQFAFDRVNSFIAGGFAADLDNDLMIEEGKRGLWDNIHAKRERIKHGSGEHMRKPGSKGAPTDAAIKASQNEAADPCWDNYKQVGMKMKGGKKVPNCVPVKEANLDETSVENKIKKNIAAKKIGVAAARSGDEKFNTRMNPHVSAKIRGREILQGKDRLEEMKMGNPNKLSPGARQEWKEKHKLAFAKKKAAGKPQPSKEELRQMYADAMKNTASMQKEDAVDALTTASKRLDSFLKDYEDKKQAVKTSVSNAAARIPDKKVEPTIRTPAPAKTTMKEEQVSKIHKGRHFTNSETSEPQSNNPNDPDSRFDGTTSGANVYAKATPGQGTLPHHATMKTLKKVVKETLEIQEATYKGRNVSLNKPFRTPGGPKKSAVYVDPDGDGKAKIVRFGDPNLSIKKDQPARKRSYCARSGGQGNLTKKDSANYWSRRAWNCEETISELSVPAGTTGNRTNVSTPSVAIRMASGKIEKHPPGKSGSSGGGDEE